MRSVRLVGLGLCALVVCSCPAVIKLDQLVHAKDALPPAITIASPAERGFYASTVTVTGTVTDDAAAVGDGAGALVSLAYEVTGSRHSGEVEVVQGAFTFSFSTLDLVGDQELELSATDWNGNVGRVTLTLRDDSNGPAISITSPGDQSEYRRLVRIEGQVSNSADAVGQTGEVASLAYEVMTTTLAGEVTFEEDGSFSFEFLTDGLSSDLAVKLSATDRLGDVNERVLNLKNDRTGPYLQILTPADLSYYASSVVVTGLVSDSAAESNANGEVASLGYAVAGSNLNGSPTWDASGAFSFELLTSTVSGNAAVTVRATDWNGNATEEIITLLDAGNDIPSFVAVPGNKQVTLSWDAAPFAESYTIRNLRYGQSVSNVVSPYVWQGLTNGTLQSFQLQAHTQQGHGEDNWSALVEAIPLSPATLTPRVTPEYRQLRVEWNSIPAAQEYAVLRAEHRDGPYGIPRITRETVLIDSEVTMGTSYFYKVKPVSDHEEIESDAQGGRPGRFAPERLAIVGSSNVLSIPGGLDVSGAYVYVATGVQDSENVLMVFEVSDPAVPMLLSECALAGQALDLAYWGGHAYVAEGESIEVVDVSSAANPHAVGAISLPPDGDRALAAAGGYLYVADADGFHVYSLGALSSPTLVATCAGIPAAHRAAITRGRAYVLSDCLYAVDVSTPGTPSVLGWWAFPGSGSAVAALGDRAFVAYDDGGSEVLTVVDFTDPADPTVRGSCAATGVLRLACRDDFVYIADRLALTVVGVSSAGVPTVLGSRGFGALFPARFVSVADHHAFTSYDFLVLEVIDITTPLIPTPVASAGTPLAAPAAIAVSGDVAVVVEYSDVCVLDVSDPTAPAVLGACPIPTSSARGVALSGKHAYVAAETSGLVIVDLGTPSAPRVVATLPPDSDLLSAEGVAVSGSTAYVAEGVLKVVDVSDPEHPAALGTYMDSFGVWAVAMLDPETVVVTCGGWGLAVVDVSDPRSPREVGACATSLNAIGVAVLGQYAYVAEGTTVEVIDLADRAAPRVVGSCTGFANARAITAQGTYAFVGDGSRGLTVVDVIDPTAPTIVATCSTPGGADGVAVSGGYAFVAGGTGLHVIAIARPSPGR